MSNQKISFATLALGKEYRLLSLLLAYDISVFHSECKLYVLTDKPSLYSNLKNVIPIQHSFGGVRRCYHDKRFAICAALENHETCIFLDADSRLTCSINEEGIYKYKSFMTVVMMENLELKLKKKRNKRNVYFALNTGKRLTRLFRFLSTEIGINFKAINHVSEGCIIFQKKYADHKKFIEYWNYVATFLSLKLHEPGEGSTIGLCALGVNTKIEELGFIPDWLFNDEYTQFKEKDGEQNKIEQEMVILRKKIGVECQESKFTIYSFPLYIFRYIKNLVQFYYARKKLFYSL